MSQEKLLYFTDIQFLDSVAEQENPMISKVKIRIAAAGVANRMLLTKEVLEDAAIKTLAFTPIVALYNVFKKDFGGHGYQAVMNEDGSYVTTSDTRAIGVIPGDPEIFWEDGYLTTFGYLWTERYKESIESLDGRPQSMELSPTKTIFENIGNGVTKIVETAFLGLCILGKDIKPAIPGASVSGYGFSENDQEGEEDKVAKDIERLLFAIQNEFKTPLVVDIDGEERDAENRKKITEAINVLDEAADLIEEEEASSKIDDALTQLVEAEVEMKKEADVIPVTEAARRGLQGTPGYKDGIVSTDNLNYAKAENALFKKKGKKEEDELAKEKKEEKEVVVQESAKKEAETQEKMPSGEAAIAEDKKMETTVAKEEKIVPAQPEEKQPVEPEAKEEQKIGSQGEARDSEGVPGGEVEKVEPETEVSQGGETEKETIDAGSEVQEDPQGPAAAAISEGRKTAEDKRTSTLLSDISDDQLFNYLIERLEQQEEVRSRLEGLLGDAIPATLSEGGEVEIPDQASTVEEIGVSQVDNPAEADVEIKVDEETDSALGEEDVETTEATEDRVAEPNEDSVKEEEPEAETEEPETETEEDEDDKKKKVPNFSLDFREIIAENEELTKANISMNKELEERKKFKSGVERQAKEEIILEFSLSEDAVQSITKDLDSLSLEEVEAKAALAQHRETKAKLGQKAKVSGIQFSIETEETSLDPVLNALRQAKEGLNRNSH